ncbi:MAG: hypothetical protein WDN04_20575 [Rhodospirillales bacterium]
MVDLVALDQAAARDGLDAWHDPALWHRSKQEVSPRRWPRLRRPGGAADRGAVPAARTSAWCWTSTIRCGAALSATTGWKAS